MACTAYSDMETEGVCDDFGRYTTAFDNTDRPETGPKAETISEARHALDRLVGLLPEKLEDVRLVVSELVTNSVLHAGLSPDDRISLMVRVSAGSVRGGGCDPGPGFEAPSEPFPRPDLRGGGGLPLVETISD